MTDAPELTLENVAGRIQELVHRLEQYHDPELRRVVFELLDLIDTMHREALERIVSLQSDRLPQLTADPVIGHLLSIYGLLGDPDPDSLVEESLEEVRPYVYSHGGEMELIEIEGGVVRLRLLGACDSCPSATVTLSQSVEAAIRRRWPGLVRLEVGDTVQGNWTRLTIQGRRGGRG
ncbi:MAG: NifU family protein [Acidimicrobiia bacterium]|nr:NifU family protein [Acidimicrobiia bacterium]